MTVALILTDFGMTQTRGTSSVARYVAEQSCLGRRRLQESHALRGLEARGILEELATVAMECAESNWDGYGAEPVSQGSYLLAREFLNALPIGTVPSSVGAVPDGQMTLEWYRSPYRVLSVSVDPAGVLHYAALLGSSTRHGVEPFYGEVPRPILELIGRVAAR